MLLATYFGTSREADAFALAYFLPDTIGSNLLASALNIACIPVFSALYARGELIQLHRTARKTLLVFTCLAAAVLLLMISFHSGIANLLTASRSAELASLTQTCLGLMLPIIAIYPSVAIGSALLQTFGSFKWYAAVPLLPHIVLLATVLGCLTFQVDRTAALTTISVAVCCGVAGMAAVAWIVAGSALRKGRPNRRIEMETKGDTPAGGSGEKLPRVGIAFALYVCTLVAAQLVYLLERKLSASLEVGTVAGLNYAFRLSQLPIAVFTAAVYSVALPSLAQDLALGRKESLRKAAAGAIHQIVLIAVPATLFLFFMRTAVVSVLFERGAFDARSVQVTSGILQGYSLSIVGLSITALVLRYFMAAGKMLIPLLVTMVSSASNIFADYALIDSMQGAGIGYGAAIGAAMSAALLLICLSGELQFSFNEMWRPFGKIAAINVPLGGLFLGCSYMWQAMPSPGSWLWRAAALMAVILSGAAIYGLGIWKVKPLRS